MLAGLIRNEAEQRLPGPRRLHEKPMLFAEVAGRGGHNGTLANHDLTILFEGLPDVVFTDEGGGRLR